MYLELTKMNCLILDDIHPIFIEQATALGLKVDVAINIESTEIERRVGSYEIIVINSKVKVDNVLINKAVKLKYILRPGSGLENVDVEYAASKNIICINSPEGNCNAVAEHTLAMILMWHHKILKAANEVKQGVWLRKENTGIELKNKTIGILGYGNVGMALSDKLLSFGVRILVFDKYKKGFSKLGIEECSVEKIMEEADIISFHVPLTDETNYMVDEHFINQLKKDVLLVNTSRGKVVKTKAIVNALQQKKLLGACLDVLENENSSSFNADEKQDFNYLCNAENVILTPHIAGWTVEAKKDMAEVLIKKIKKIFHN
jgi:D-3-phosphoglycerate dehydrogenase